MQSDMINNEIGQQKEKKTEIANSFFFTLVYVELANKAVYAGQLIGGWRGTLQMDSSPTLESANRMHVHNVFMHAWCRDTNLTARPSQ